MTYATGRAGFRMFLWALQGKVTLLPRLLVVGQLLQLVILVFEECLELYEEVLLFIVGCWLLCNRYVWSYWFSRDVLFKLLLFLLLEVMLAVYAICMASHYGLLGCKLKCKDILFKKFWYFPTVLVISFLSGVLCFCGWEENCFMLDYFKTKLQKPCGPVHQGNLAVYYLFMWP